MLTRTIKVCTEITHVRKIFTMMAKIAPCQAFYDLMKSWRKLANSTEGLRSLGTKKDLYAGPLAINLHQNRDLVTVQYRKREDGTIFVYYKLNTA